MAIKLKRPKQKTARIAIQARIPQALYEVALKRLKSDEVSWQDLLEASVKAYAEGAVFFSK